MAVFRNTTLGCSLTDALDVVVPEFGLSDAMTKTIYKQFEQSLGRLLDECPNTMNITGICSNFRDVNNVWRLESTQLKAVTGKEVINATNTIVVLCLKPK